jgi:hypothetical protein
VASKKKRSSGYLKGVADISDGVFFVVVEGLGNPQLSAGQAFGSAASLSSGTEQQSALPVSTPSIC